MELRNLITAREMVDTGQWLLPTMNGELRLAKPPLPTWLAALGALVGGGFRDLTAMRLPTVFAALIGAVAVATYSRALKLANRTSWLAALVLTTTFLYAHESRLATWDVPAHAFAMAGIATVVSSGNGRRPWMIVVAGVFFAASILSKGPVALAVLALPWLVVTAYWRREDLAIGWRGLGILVGVTLTLGLAWPLHVHLHAPGPLADTVIHEAGTWIGYHTRPPWFYATAPLMLGVWAPVGVAALLTPWLAPRLASRHETRILLSWTIVSLILIALIPMKKDRYLLPVLFPWSIAVAHWWSSPRDIDPHIARGVARIQTYWAVAFVSVAALGLPVLALWRPLETMETVVAAILLAAGFVVVLAVTLGMSEPGRRAVYASLGAALAVMAAGWHLQSRLELPHVRKAEFADVGRRDGRLALPAFSSDARSLGFVWDVGRPLSPFPADGPAFERTMDKWGVDPPWRVLWLAREPPPRDEGLRSLAAWGFGVQVARGDTFVRHWEEGAEAHWLSLVTVYPKREGP
jgi:4-amino-4-deoxy-L-arabinose transferase-like glycosyltransferase